MVHTVLVKIKILIKNKTKYKMNNKRKKNVINKLLKLLWYGVGDMPPTRLWAGRRPGGLLLVRSKKKGRQGSENKA